MFFMSLKTTQQLQLMVAAFELPFLNCTQLVELFKIHSRILMSLPHQIWPDRLTLILKNYLIQ